ncbi:MAG: hypothetical protein QOJ59_2053 [Thermomicrobiales bacterium]|nr:hypothetical protein [Thermomicrobiales bacterium]
MSHLEMAMLLLALVISVLVATRPAPPRRRSRSTRPRGGKPHPNDRGAATLSVRRSAPPPQPDAIHRNRWDRTDIASGVGHDYAQPDAALTHWPVRR